MRALIVAVVLAIFAMAIAAEVTAQQPAKRQTTDPLLNESARVKECMKQWDRTTHMTRKEWEATCRRVAKERIKYLRDQGYGIERKKPAPRSKSSQM